MMGATVWGVKQPNLCVLKLLLHLVELYFIIICIYVHAYKNL